MPLRDTQTFLSCLKTPGAQQQHCQQGSSGVYIWSPAYRTHPHRDAEIFSYIIDGHLSHKDSMGNNEALPRGCVQYLSAGTGIAHSVCHFSQCEHPSCHCSFPHCRKTSENSMRFAQCYTSCSYNIHLASCSAQQGTAHRQLLSHCTHLQRCNAESHKPSSIATYACMLSRHMCVQADEPICTMLCVRHFALSSCHAMPRKSKSCSSRGLQCMPC